MAPNSQIKPVTAFSLYYEQARPRIVKELGDGAQVKGAVVKIAAERWKAFPDAAKASLELKAAALKADSDKTLEAIKEGGGEIAALKADSDKTLEAFKESGDEIQCKTKKCDAPAAVKASLEQKAAALKAEYEKTLEAIKAGGGDMQRKAKKGKEQQKPKKDVNAPKRPAGGGYGVYLSEHRAEIAKSLPDDAKMTDVTKAAGVKWKELSEAAKQPYETKYQAKKIEYKAAVEACNAAGGGGVKDDVAEEASPQKTAPKKDSLATKKRGGVSKPETDEAAPPAKRGKGGEPEIDSAVLGEAEKLGYASQLKNLFVRSEITALNLSSEKVLQALNDSQELVDPAKLVLGA